MAESLLKHTGVEIRLVDTGFGVKEFVFEIPLPPLEGIEPGLIRNAMVRVMAEWNLEEARSRRVSYRVDGDHAWAFLDHELTGTGHVEGGFEIRGQDLAFAPVRQHRMTARYVVNRDVAERLARAGLRFAYYLGQISRGEYEPVKDETAALMRWRSELNDLEQEANRAIRGREHEPFTPEDDEEIRRFLHLGLMEQSERRFDLCRKLGRPWSTIARHIDAVGLSA